jgi:hypothetical protein
MTDFRFVMPVTTASGNVVGGLVAVGLAVGAGEIDDVAVADGEGSGVRLGPRQPARSTTEAPREKPRGNDE